MDFQELLVRIDPVQFEQLLTNLVVNAGHAISEYGTVTVLTHLREQVVLEVQDTGKGISPGDQEHIGGRLVRDQGGRERDVASDVPEALRVVGVEGDASPRCPLHVLSVDGHDEQAVTLG